MNQEDGLDPFDEMGVLVGFLLVLVEEVCEERGDRGGGDSANGIPEDCDGLEKVKAGVEEGGVGGVQGLEEGLLQVVGFGRCVLVGGRCWFCCP